MTNAAPVGPAPLPPPLSPALAPTAAAHPDEADALVMEAAAPAGYTVTPSLVLGGVTIASAPDSSLTNQVVLDGLSVSWGRSDVMDQPSPQTASFSLFDPSTTWAIGRDLIGQLVLLNATIVGPTGTTTFAFFRGRITSAKLTRHAVQRSDGTVVNGVIVACAASSLLNDLANRIPREDWPAETMDARRARIAGYASPVCSSVTIRGYWKTPNVAPIATASQVSIYDHLQNLYSSCGPDRWTWIPWSQTAVQLERRDYAGASTLGELHWDVPGTGTARDGLGAYARSIAHAPYDGGLAATPLYIDGEMIEFDPSDGASKDITSRITRVDVQYPDVNNSYQNLTATTLVLEVDEAVSGVRTASEQSLVAWNNFAVQASSDLAIMAGREAAGWKLDPFTVRSDLNGGQFDNYDQASILLLGAETITSVFLQRSWFAHLGIRPVFGLIGGTIRYAGTSWSLDYRVSPVNTLPMHQHALTWDEIDDGSTGFQLQWWDDDNSHGLHESLTYEDIGFVGRGLNVSTTPGDPYSWDYWG